MKLIIDVPNAVYIDILETNTIKGHLGSIDWSIRNGKPYEERPQGEWIFDREFTEFGNPYGTYRCSICGGHSSNKYPFCKDCGAYMNKGAEENG